MEMMTILILLLALMVLCLVVSSTGRNQGVLSQRQQGSTRILHVSLEPAANRVV
jgi:hypothetical protein